jgi:hypothetical protein
MLPGFRFLFAAIVLSMSILVFGLGAAALLRTAHEEFASNPAWRAAPETVFTQPAETTPPMLAMLRVEPPATDPKAPQNIPANTPADVPANIPTSAPPAEPAPMASAPPEPAPSASPAADEPQQVATVTPEASSPPEPAKPEMPVAELAVTGAVAPVQTGTPASETATAVPAPAAETAVPAPAEETKVASSEVAKPEEVKKPEVAKSEAAKSEEALPPTAQIAPIPSDPISPPMTPQASIAATRIATLGGPAVTISAPPAKVSNAKSEPPKSDIKGAIKKHREARRAAKHRKLAARARVAQQAQQPADPFAPAAPTTPARRH